MKTKKMMMIAGLGTLLYYLLKKKRSTKQNEDEPGMLEKFTSKITESINKDMDEVASDIPQRAAMNNSVNTQ